LRCSRRTWGSNDDCSAIPFADLRAVNEPAAPVVEHRRRCVA
jgi:hypothetical protein